MPKFLSVDQNSAAWLKAREGRITGSRLADVISYCEPTAAQAKDAGFKLVRDAVAAGLQGKESAKRANYRMELIAERLTGMAVEKYVSPAMDWGTEYEPMARAAYELAYDVMVDQVGFAVHPTLDFSGASPDCLVGDKGMAEFKCPNTTTHLEYRMNGVVPELYEPQMMWEMECCERFWCDFVSFDPRLPDDLRIFVMRLDYDPARAKYLREEVRKFNAEIEDAIARLRGGSTLKQKLTESLEAVR